MYCSSSVTIRGMVAWKVGVKVADAACSTPMARYNCHSVPMNGRVNATPARTRSAATSTGFARHWAASAVITGDSST